MSEKTIEAHPVADIFPLMSVDELTGLVEDIRSHGLREPIWLHPDGRIIDGRNRYRACLEGAVRPVFRTWDGGGSLVDFVLSLNLHRRHLSQSQKAAVALKVEAIYATEAKERMAEAGRSAAPGRPAEKGEEIVPQVPDGERNEQARDRAGKAVGVSGRYVQDAKKIADQAPDLMPAVESGEMTLPKATQEMNHRNGRARYERSQKRAAEARRLANEGMDAQQIAEALGVSDSSVGNYLREADQSPRSGDRATLNRLMARAAGLADAANNINGGVKHPETSEVARWVDDLTRTIRALSQLRTRIKEHNQP